MRARAQKRQDFSSWRRSDLQPGSQKWKKFPRKTSPRIMRFFSQAKSVSRLISDTSTLAAAVERMILELFRAKSRSWPAFSNERGHDESGFNRFCETPLARVLPTSPAHSGRC